jgi:hypothetical protein
MRKLTFIFLLVTWQLVTGDLCYANNIAVSNVTITGQSTSAQTCKVQFDISWNNSWRNAINYDAAWVFIKYSTDSGTTWAHATLKTAGTNPSGFSQGTGTGLDIVVPTDKKGAFLQRTSNGSGSVSTTSIQFVWDWGADGLSASSTARVKVFAIEMVYVPTGAFYAGSGGTGTGEFTLTQITTATANASGGYPTGQTAPNASWPNGYNAFYIMKYELSQGAWVDFFNTLTATQKTTRDITSATGKNSDGTVYRNTISWTSGDASAGANQYVACNYLSWQDVAAFADWAGLRPMTELEYEKAARGTASAVANEYAWGSTTITQVTGITNGGASNETASNSGNGLCAYGNHASVQGPMRCGFAATASTTRAQAGASYYGVMELSGNLWERPVTVGNATGRAFDGANGDGALATNGNANGTSLQYWPGYSAGEITGATGSGFRGGDWFKDATYARVSDRYYAADTGTGRDYRYGARCARTSP